MRQATKTLVGLAVLMSVAGGLAWLAWKSESRAAAKPRKTAPTTLVTTVPDELRDAGAPIEFSRLAITFEGATTEVERHVDGGWRLISPVHAPADKPAVDGALAQLKRATVKATLDEHPDHAALEKFGLAPFVFRVEARGLAQGAPVTVLLEGGVENPFDGSIFVRRDGAPTVYSAEGGVRYALARTTFDLRDKQVLAVDEPALAGVKVKSAAADWAVERGPDGLWAFADTHEAADPAPLSAMLALLGAQRAQAFPEVAKARFEHPSLDATLTPKAGAPVRLRFVDEPGRTLLLREEGTDVTVLELAAQTGHQLDRPRADLKDPVVFRFKKELAAALELSSPAGTVVVRRQAVDASAQTWRVTEPRDGPAKVLKVGALVWTLSTLRAKSWLPRALPAHGLDGKARSITVRAADGKVLARFRFGHEVGPGTLVIEGAAGHVALVDAERLTDLPWTADELLDEPSLSDAGRPAVP